MINNDEEIDKYVRIINDLESVNKDSLLLDSKQVAIVLNLKKGMLSTMRKKEKIFKKKRLEIPSNIVESIEVGGKVMYEKRKIAEFLSRK